MWQLVRAEHGQHHRHGAAAISTGCGLRAIALYSADFWCTSAGPFPLDGFGVENCLLYQSCDSQFASATTSTGPTSAQHALPVLNLPSLVGVSVYLQAWGLSPGYNTAGIIVSNAMSLMVGNS